MRGDEQSAQNLKITHGRDAVPVNGRIYSTGKRERSISHWPPWMKDEFERNAACSSGSDTKPYTRGSPANDTCVKAGCKCKYRVSRIDVPVKQPLEFLPLPFCPCRNMLGKWDIAYENFTFQRQEGRTRPTTRIELRHHFTRERDVFKVSSLRLMSPFRSYRRSKRAITDYFSSSLPRRGGKKMITVNRYTRKYQTLSLDNLCNPRGVVTKKNTCLFFKQKKKRKKQLDFNSI